LCRVSGEFKAAWDEGRALDVDAAVEVAHGVFAALAAGT
jgi:hypothetical protein